MAFKISIFFSFCLLKSSIHVHEGCVTCYVKDPLPLTVMHCALFIMKYENEDTEWENAQRLPCSAFDQHRAEIQQSKEEIKANYAVD